MSLSLVTTPPADALKPLADALFAADQLTLRQYRVWCLKHFTPQTLYAICQQMQAEGFTGHRHRPVSLATVKAALVQATKIIDAAALAQSEEDEGPIRFAVVVTHGRETRLSADTTAQAAHKRLGLGIQVKETPHDFARKWAA